MLVTLLSASIIARPIDVSRSSAHFSVEHIWVDRVIGSIPIESGRVTLEPGSPFPVSVTAALSYAGVKTDDPDRDASLRSSDFFDAARFPTWMFASTRIVPTGAESFEMDGLLRIHGVAKPERLDVTVAGTPQQPLYHAVGKIDRTAFWHEENPPRPRHRESRRRHVGRDAAIRKAGPHAVSLAQIYGVAPARNL